MNVGCKLADTQEYTSRDAVTGMTTLRVLERLSRSFFAYVPSTLLALQSASAVQNPLRGEMSVARVRMLGHLRAWAKGNVFPC